MKIFLDDIRTPKMAHNEEKGLGLAYSDASMWTIARTYQEFVNIVDANFGRIDMISFDHDLACFGEDGREMTGKSAADYVINKCLDEGAAFPKDWYVHSDNTSGRQNIVGAILNYLDKVEGIDVSGIRKDAKGIVGGKAA